MSDSELIRKYTELKGKAEEMGLRVRCESTYISISHHNEFGAIFNTIAECDAYLDGINVQFNIQDNWRDIRDKEND